MLNKMAAGVVNANKWAQEKEHLAVGLALQDILFAVTKLLFSLTYFVLALVQIVAWKVETMVTKGRTAVDERQSRKLKGHLNWDRSEEDPPRRVAYLRR